MAAKTNDQLERRSVRDGEEDEAAGRQGGGDGGATAGGDVSSDKSTTDDEDEDRAPAADVVPPPTSLIRLHQTKQWLQQQIREHQIEVEAAKDKSPPSSDDLEQLSAKITELEQKLLNMSMKAEMRETLTNRLMSGNLLRRRLFPSQSEKDEMGAAAKEQQKKLIDLVYRQMELVSQIVTTQTEVDELQTKTDELKKSSFGTMVRSRELMSELQTAKQQASDRAEGAADTDRTQIVKNQLSNLLDKTIVVRHMFQGLILGSGINWAADPEDLNLVLNLGRPIDKCIEGV